MWIELNDELLLRRVSAPEREALAFAATDPSQLHVLEETAAMVAADWRSGLRRITVLHQHQQYVPDELLSHILADFRYRAFTRLPGMESLLDDLRVKEWERAMSVRDALHKWVVTPPEPEYAESPERGRPLPLIRDPDEYSVLG